MSPLRLQGSTSGFSQIDAPAVAGDQTFTLPGTGGTLDRLNRAGNILQVVQGSTSTAVSISAITFADTGLSASITPSSASNKILVIVDQGFYHIRTSNLSGIGIQLVRGSTVIHAPVQGAGGPYDFYFAAGGATSITVRDRGNIIYLDSPNTTSSVTYKTQGALNSTANSAACTFQENNTTNMTSYITLVEVAA